MFRFAWMLVVLNVAPACQDKPEAENPYVDSDGDGHTTETDCNDGDASVFPEAEEVCDDIDQDCDGVPDNGVSTYFYVDSDADGFGNPTIWTLECNQPNGYVANNQDCNDLDFDINPLGFEVCDETDNNCNGLVDEGVSNTYFYDSDQDGYGGVDIQLQACSLVSGFSENYDDCNDFDPTIYPGAEEICDGLDNDCDMVLDNGFEQNEFYSDTDGDGYGDDVNGIISACVAPQGFTDVPGDCDDSDALTNPDAVEQCNTIDDDCNGQIDDGVIFSNYYIDADGDGYGDPTTELNDCVAPQGYVLLGEDCDDANPLVFPDAIEDCFDGIDNNCNSEVDCMELLGCMDVEPSCWVCGDGVVGGDEDCDDGNLLDGDGCSSLCENEGIFGLCVSDWCYQNGTMDQYTRCTSLADGGDTCIEPEIKYGSVEGGIPRSHGGNNYDAWCQQLGAQGYSTYATGTRTGGALFGCTSYDENTWHWCDWQDGYWYNQSLDSVGTQSDFILSITCY